MTTAADVLTALEALLAKAGQDYLAEFEAWGTAEQAWLADVSAAVEGINATSTATITPASGANVFSSLLPTSRTWEVGTVLRAVSRANAGIYCQGAVSASSAGSVTITGTLIAGGAASDWDISVPIQTTAAPRTIVEKAGNYTILQSDIGKIFLVTTTCTIKLPLLSGGTDGEMVGVKNVGSGLVTVQRSDSETSGIGFIDGLQASCILLPGEGYDFLNNDDYWPRLGVKPELVVLPLETDAATPSTGTAKNSFVAPRGGAIVIAPGLSLRTGQSSGSAYTADLNISGSSIYGGNKPMIDNGETESSAGTTAASYTGPTIFAAGAVFTADCDVAGTGGKAPKFRFSFIPL